MLPTLDDAKSVLLCLFSYCETTWGGFWCHNRLTQMVIVTSTGCAGKEVVYLGQQPIACLRLDSLTIRNHLYRFHLVGPRAFGFEVSRETRRHSLENAFGKVTRDWSEGNAVCCCRPSRKMDYLPQNRRLARRGKSRQLHIAS